MFWEKIRGGYVEKLHGVGARLGSLNKVDIWSVDWLEITVKRWPGKLDAGVTEYPCELYAFGLAKKRKHRIDSVEDQFEFGMYTQLIRSYGVRQVTGR